MNTKYMWSIGGSLRNLVAFVQFKKTKKYIHWGMLKHPSRRQPVTLLKVTVLEGCFSRFLSGTNDTKKRKASHIPLYLDASRSCL